MKKNLCFLFLTMALYHIMVFFSSCSSKNESAPPSEQKQENVQGVGQGNGMLVYQNNTMGLKFNYPSVWALTENSDRTAAFFNIPVVKESTASEAFNEKWYLNFSYVSTLFDLQPKTPEELKKIIDQNIPEKKWAIKNFGGREVVYTTEQLQKNEWANYYILDQRGNILQIEYLFGKTLEPEKFIRTIMTSILIDDEAPVIQRVWFDKPQVTPGSTLRLYVEITDDLSGVDFESIGFRKYYYGGSFATIGYNTDQLTAIGSTSSCEKIQGYQYDIARCELSHQYTILLKNKFKYLEGNIFYYDIPVSAHAPLGELVLTRFDVKDTQGNSAQLDAIKKLETEQFSKYEYYSSCSTVISQAEKCQTNSPKVITTEIIQPTTGNYIPDLKRPELTDLYWSSPSVIFDRNMELNLNLQFSDESPIQEDMAFILRSSNNAGTTSSNISTQDCLYTSQTKALGNNKFTVTFKIKQYSSCSDGKYFFDGQTGPAKIWVDGIKVRDEVGRSSDFFIFSKTPPRVSYPQPLDYKAVVFTKHLFLLNP